MSFLGSSPNLGSVDKFRDDDDGIFLPIHEMAGMGYGSRNAFSIMVAANNIRTDPVSDSGIFGRVPEGKGEYVCPTRFPI